MREDINIDVLVRQGIASQPFLRIPVTVPLPSTIAGYSFSLRFSGTPSMGNEGVWGVCTRVIGLWTPNVQPKKFEIVRDVVCRSKYGLALGFLLHSGWKARAVEVGVSLENSQRKERREVPSSNGDGYSFSLLGRDVDEWVGVGNGMWFSPTISSF